VEVGADARSTHDAASAPIAHAVTARRMRRVMPGA
jgi:hypothetical protein